MFSRPTLYWKAIWTVPRTQCRPLAAFISLLTTATCRAPSLSRLSASKDVAKTSKSCRLDVFYSLATSPPGACRYGNSTDPGTSCARSGVIVTSVRPPACLPLRIPQSTCYHDLYNTILLFVAKSPKNKAFDVVIFGIFNLFYLFIQSPLLKPAFPFVS